MQPDANDANDDIFVDESEFDHDPRGYMRLAPDRQLVVHDQKGRLVAVFGGSFVIPPESQLDMPGI